MIPETSITAHDVIHIWSLRHIKGSLCGGEWNHAYFRMQEYIKWSQIWASVTGDVGQNRHNSLSSRVCLEWSLQTCVTAAFQWGHGPSDWNTLFLSFLFPETCWTKTHFLSQIHVSTKQKPFLADMDVYVYISNILVTFYLELCFLKTLYWS